MTSVKTNQEKANMTSSEVPKYEDFDADLDRKEGAKALCESGMSPELLIGRLLKARSIHAWHLNGQPDMNDDGIRQASSHLRTDRDEAIAELDMTRRKLSRASLRGSRLYEEVRRQWNKGLRDAATRQNFIVVGDAANAIGDALKVYENSK